MTGHNCTAPFRLPSSDLAGQFTFVVVHKGLKEAIEVCQNAGAVLAPAKTPGVAEGISAHYKDNNCYSKLTKIANLVYVAAVASSDADMTSYLEDPNAQLFSVPTKVASNHPCTYENGVLNVHESKLYNVYCRLKIPLPSVCYYPLPPHTTPSSLPTTPTSPRLQPNSTTPTTPQILHNSTTSISPRLLHNSTTPTTPQLLHNSTTSISPRLLYNSITPTTPRLLHNSTTSIYAPGNGSLKHTVFATLEILLGALIILKLVTAALCLFFYVMRRVRKSRSPPRRSGTLEMDIRNDSFDDSLDRGFKTVCLETDFNRNAFGALKEAFHSTSLQNQPRPSTLACTSSHLRPSSEAVDARLGRLPPLPWRPREQLPVDMDVQAIGSSDDDEDASSELSEPRLSIVGIPVWCACRSS